MADGARQIQVFVSSPADARFERSRLERVVERLNGEFAGVAQLIAIRWENEFYKAHDTFQAQIPEAAQCEIVIAIFRGRLGTTLPDDFPHMADGKPYPSGTAYEVLSAIEASKGRGLPDVYVFRYPQPPLVQLDDPKEAETKQQWEYLKGFFEQWFRTPTGQFKAAFQNFTSTDDFEAQVEALLRKWLEDKVLHGRSMIWPVELKGSPFRGLAAFGAKHAPVFFGRNRDIAKATDRFKDAAEKACAFLLVDGASGSGKSSLVRAGLLPRLTAAGVVPTIDVWRTAVMRPGETGGDPFTALARALFVRAEDLPDDDQGRPPALPELAATDFPTPHDLAGLLGHADDTALRPIAGALTAICGAVQKKEGYDRDVRSALLLVVDQLDELFDAQISQDVRTRFAALLGRLARSGRVWVVVTLRADLFDRFLNEPVLKQLKEDGASYDLAPPDVVELAQIVREPAVAADLVYDTDAATGERLDERLLADAGRPDLLPLLQFTLNQLFEARTKSGEHTLLTFAAYRALGGLEGAVDKEAEAALKGLGEAEQAKLPRLLRQLAAPAADVGIGTAYSAFDIRAVPLADAAYDEASGRLVRALVNARILLSSGEGNLITVRLAHARVLDSWQRAKAIVAENADFFRIRSQVEEQRRRWEAAGRSRDLLLGRGRPLAEAENILRRFPDEIAPATRDYIRRSGRRARLAQTLTAVAALLFAAVAAVAGVAMWQAQLQRERARAGTTAATQLANSLVFRTVQELSLHGLTQETGEIIGQLITSYNQIIAIDPTPQAYEGRGSAYAFGGDLDHAIADFTQALQLDPNYAPAYNDRGLAYHQQNDDDRAIADYNQAIALDPKYANAFNNRGNAYEAKGEFDNAIADYTKAIALDPDDAVAYNSRGVAYINKGDYKSALADLTASIARDPKYAHAYNNRGRAYRGLGDPDHAIADYTQAIALDPDYTDAYIGRGQAYDDKDDYADAMADYGKAIAIDPKDAEAYADRAFDYTKQNNYDPAIADFTKAISLDPKSYYAYSGRGMTYLNKGNADLAIADFTQAIALVPNLSLIYDLRGSAYSNKGDFVHAIADFQQATKLDPKNIKFAIDLGLASFLAGKFDDAITAFNAALALDAQSAPALYGRGSAELKKGDSTAGNADLAAARKIDPNIDKEMAPPAK